MNDPNDTPASIYSHFFVYKNKFIRTLLLKFLQILEQLKNKLSLRFAKYNSFFKISVM